MTRLRLSVILLAMPLAMAVSQETLPPVRKLGPPVAISAAEYRSVSAVRPLSGWLLVNDWPRRRLVLVDTAFTSTITVLDSVSSNRYGARPGGLYGWRTDSAVFVEAATPSMYVIAPDGGIARVMSLPVPRNATALATATVGSGAWLDPRGRFVHRSTTSLLRPGPPLKPGEVMPYLMGDSVAIIRDDPETRSEQTLTWIKTISFNGMREGLEGGGSALYIPIDPLPNVDDFVVLSDGTVVVIKADMHLELLDPDGRKASSARIPFPWVRLSDSAKVAIMDSVRRDDERRRSAQAGSRVAAGGAATGGGGGGGMIAGFPGTGSAIAQQYVYVKSSELPDYRPAFASGAARVDLADRIWIKTTQSASDPTLAVYYVVDRTGKLLERLELPNNRFIVGFDRTAAYLFTPGPNARLERVLVR